MGILKPITEWAIGPWGRDVVRTRPDAVQLDRSNLSVEKDSFVRALKHDVPLKFRRARFRGDQRRATRGIDQA